MRSLESRFRDFPPCLCRYIARHRGRGLSNEDLASRSGLSTATIRKLSRQTSWDGVSVSVALAYAKACGVDFLRLRRQIDFIKRRKMAHVLRAGPQQAGMYVAVQAAIEKFSQTRRSQASA